MAKPIATRELVFAAAQKIMDEGFSPSIIQVQERIGGGSYTTVKRFLEAWQEEQTTKHVIEVPPDITAKGVELAGIIWQMAAEQANKNTESIKEAAAADIEVAQAANTEALREIERLENIEIENEATIKQQAAQIHAHELSIARLEGEALRVKALEQRLHETQAALIVTEQQMAHWKAQAEQSDSLAALIATLQNKNS